MMKIVIFLLSFVAAVSSYAQGGMGFDVRTDIVMLRAAVRDSYELVLIDNIRLLEKHAAEGKAAEAAAMIAHNGGAAKTEKWTRAANLQNPEEATRVSLLMDKLKKLATEFPELVTEFYAVFKDADNPAGQKHLYQISLTSGKKKRMTSFTFYPVGELMLLGDIY
jgi:hypothetical protein